MLYTFYQKHIFPHVLNQVMQSPSLMDLRRALLFSVSDEVLEIGFGSGINLPFYQNINTVYALEPNAEIYHLAQQRIREAPFVVNHIQASAEQIPFADQSFQHLVSTWTLCSVPDLNQCLHEMYRVLKPGGTLHVVEHVLNTQNLNIQRLQHLFNPIQKRLADGCHLNRNIELALIEAGFVMEKFYYVDAVGIPKIGQRMLVASVRKPKTDD